MRKQKQKAESTKQKTEIRWVAYTSHLMHLPPAIKSPVEFVVFRPSSKLWKQKTGVPGVLFEGFAELGAQHGFFFPRFDPIPQDDAADSHDASPLVNCQSSTHRGQIDSGINGMAEISVGPRADQFVVFFESDSCRSNTVPGANGPTAR